MRSKNRYYLIENKIFRAFTSILLVEYLFLLSFWLVMSNASAGAAMRSARGGKTAGDISTLIALNFSPKMETENQNLTKI